MSASVRLSVGVYAPRDDASASLHPPMRERDHAAKDRGPHVQLDLLSHAKVRVEQVRETVAAARPGFDDELDRPRARMRPELDLTCLQMALQRGEPKRVSVDRDDPNRTVPRAGHADYVLVADAELTLLAPDLLEPGQLG